MRHRRVLAAAALLLTLSCAETFAAGPSAGGDWLTDYAEARAQSRRQDLPLLVHFHASWCGPCRQMNRETLHSPALLSLFGTQIIAVKVDSDANPGLIEAFRVEGLPADLVIAPDGHIVSRSEGYQSRSRYMTTINDWTGRFARQRSEALARNAEASPPETMVRPQIAAPPAVAQSSDPVRPAERPDTPPQVPPTIQQPAVIAEQAAPPQVDQPSPTSGLLVGLDGFSPVRIRTHREWRRGNEKFATSWQGTVYYMSNESELTQFLASPQKYAPRVLGCDPVELWNSDRAVQGSVEFGAFYDGELFLFVSADSRNAFKVAPERYTRIRSVLKPDDVSGTRLR